jgi:hypothetical protein
MSVQQEKSLFSCAATSSFCVFRRAISAISLHNKKVPWQWRGRVIEFYWQVRSYYKNGNDRDRTLFFEEFTLTLSSKQGLQEKVCKAE